ncbi:MAG: ribonuclease HI [Chloroflexi bacterium]|nr:MAG: ribonuclease HI [Chloroflexota bacterium]
MPDLQNLSNSISPRVELYTDGGCDPNPGPGGWGAIIRWRDREWTLAGNDLETTNNRMELHAAAAGLALLEGLLGRCQVNIYTDSQYLRRGITTWIDKWVSQGWRTSDKSPVKNQDLWRVLYRLTQAHDVTWHWLKGHAGHPLNERADRLATEARRALTRLHSSYSESSGHPSTGIGTGDADDDRPIVEICVKASCQGAEKRGGWGAVLRTGEHTRALSGGESDTTANAMLIQGAAEALRALTRPCRVLVYSDAKYLIEGASSWVKKWQNRGWRTKTGQPVANRDAWQALLKAVRPHHVTWLLAHGDDMPADMDWASELAARAAQGNSG